MDESPLNRESVDEILGKYVSVWLWSIVFGVTSGVTLSYFNYRTDRPWGDLGLLLAVLLVIGAGFLMLAWLYLLRYLGGVLIPRFILREAPAETRIAARALRQSVTTLLLATLCRLLLVIIELAYSSAASSSGRLGG